VFLTNLIFYQKSSGDISNFLRQISTEITNSTTAILERSMLETGYAEARLTGELQRTVNQINMFAKLIEEGSYCEAKIFKQDGKPDLRRMLVPIGPIAVFGASNFPLAFSVAGGDTISALASKCPVIVKAHPSHPGTSELVAECIIRAQQNSKMPDFIFSMLHGKSNVGEVLANQSGLKAIGFTGSFIGGKNLFDIASKRKNPIPVYAEMGSINPVFIFPDALETKSKEIADALVQSTTASSGQMCTKPGVIFTIGKSNQKFLEHASKAIQVIPSAYLLNNGIKEGFKKGTQKISSNKGVTTVGSGLSGSPNSVQVTMFSTDSQTFLNQSVLHEEVFGPSSLVVHCDSLETSYNVLSKLDGQLTGTVHATEKDLKNSKQFITSLMDKVGRVIFNGVPTGVEVCSAINHSGPFPSTTCVNYTSVGTDSIKRWLRPICFQNSPNEILPEELKNENTKGMWRMINDVMTKDNIK